MASVDEMKVQIESLRAEIKRLQGELKAVSTETVRHRGLVSEEATALYGDALNFKLREKNGMNLGKPYGNTIKAFSIAARQVLFPDKFNLADRQGLQSKVTDRVETYTDNEYDTYMKYMVRLFDFLLEVDAEMKAVQKTHTGD